MKTTKFICKVCLIECVVDTNAMSKPNHCVYSGGAASWEKVSTELHPEKFPKLDPNGPPVPCGCKEPMEDRTSRLDEAFDRIIKLESGIESAEFRLGRDNKSILSLMERLGNLETKLQKFLDGITGGK